MRHENEVLSFFIGEYRLDAAILANSMDLWEKSDW
jgi:hypothetical protein